MFDKFLQKYITAKNIVFFIVMILLLVFLARISEIAIMFFACFVIACSLEPPVQYLSKKFNRNAACAIVLLGSILLICAFFVPIIAIGSHEIKEFAESFPQYLGNIKTFITSNHLLSKSTLSQIDINGVISSVSGTTSQFVGEILNIGKNFGSAILYLILSILIIYYFMIDKDKVKSAILRLFPIQMRERAGEIIDAIAIKSGGYVIAQLVAIASIGIIVTVGLMFLKNDYALLLGLISAVFDIVPIVGPAIAFLICMIVVYKSGPFVVAMTAVIFAAAQLIENNFVRPFVFSKFLDLHPLIIYLFILIAAKYMGLLGVVFAPAIAATVVVLIEELYMKSLE